MFSLSILQPPLPCPCAIFRQSAFVALLPFLFSILLSCMLGCISVVFFICSFLKKFDYR